MKNTLFIGFGLVLFLASAFGGLPTAAEAMSVAYPNMNWQYPQQYDYWQGQYPQYYTTDAGYYVQHQSCDPYAYLYGYGYGYTACDSYGYDYGYQQQLADWRYQQQLAQYYAQLQSMQYYNNVVYQGGQPYYVPACSYDDRVHSTCHQYQFTAELMGANNDISCQFYGQCWSYGNGWPYAY